jgi:parallel beta-helix repeat protein
LAGHILTATGPTPAEGVRAENVTGLKITGGTFVGFPLGIRLDNTPNTRVVGVTATSGRIGIFVGNTTGALLAGNTTKSNGMAGISLVCDSDRNRVVSNTATGNSPDPADFNPPANPCPNTWPGNAFTTDNEGDGRGAGCIR